MFEIRAACIPFPTNCLESYSVTQNIWTEEAKKANVQVEHTML